MKKEDLFNAIGEADNELLEQSENKRGGGGWIKFLAAAACLAVIIYGGTRYFRNDPSGGDITGGSSGSSEENPSGLPMLTVDEDAGVFGFEGYMAFDISDLVSANPWTEEAGITTLPVYRNTTASGQEEPVPDEERLAAMKELLLDVAGRLGLDAGSLDIATDVPDADRQAAITEMLTIDGESVPENYFAVHRISVESDGIKITVDASMTALISFDPAVSLPEGLTFNHFSTYGQLTEVAVYLQGEYSALLGADRTAVNISGGDYNIYRQQGYLLSFFDGSGSIAEQIINFNFNLTAFYCDDDDRLFLARVYEPELTEKLGDYPIISTEEAKELLLNGNYITSVPCEMPGEEYIARVELIYRTGNSEEYFMPYYRFYVELPEMAEKDGLLTYGAYYVPAVSGEYIYNMPVWDGSFN